MKLLSLATISILLLTVSSQAVTPFAEQFTATSLNTSRWTLVREQGLLSQTDGRINFSSKTPLTGDTGAHVILSDIQPSYNENWEILVTIVNRSLEDTSMGIAVVNAADMDDIATLEIYYDGANRFVSGNYATNDVLDDEVLKAITAKKMYFRIRFNKSDKVLTYWYRTSTTAAWTKHSTFSTKGSTLTTRRGNWGMTNTSKFGIGIFGGSDHAGITSGQMFADNFKIRNY